LVNLAGCILLYALLKFKLFLLPKCFYNLLPNVFKFIASKSVKPSFSLNSVLERANDLQ